MPQKPLIPTYKTTQKGSFCHEHGAQLALYVHLQWLCGL